MADDVDYGYNHHQGADFAMESANMRVSVSGNPYRRRSQAADHGQQKHPPQYPCEAIAVLPEADEPIGETVMKENVVDGQSHQNHAEADVKPHSPFMVSGACLQLYSGD